MKQVKNIAILLATYGLLIAIVFPSLLQLQHVFEDHRHTFCGNVDTHIHEQDLDCDLDNFHFITFTFEPQNTVVSNIDNQLPTVENFYNSSVYSTPTTAVSLRGPPAMFELLG